MVGEVEPLGQELKTEFFGDLDIPAEARAEAKKIEPGTGVAINKNAVDGRTCAGSLHGVGASGDVERQCGVRLQHGAQLEAVTDAFPGGRGFGQGRVDGAIEREAVALIV